MPDEYGTNYSTRLNQPFDDLKGQIFDEVYLDGSSIWFKNKDRHYVLMHHQDCCESVDLDYVDGDISFDAMVGQEILWTDFVQSRSPLNGEDTPKITNEDRNSMTWSYHTIRTNLDTWKLSWFGVSNGCYRETAQLDLVWDREEEIRLTELHRVFDERSKMIDQIFSAMILNRLNENGWIVSPHPIKIRLSPNGLYLYSVYGEGEDKIQIKCHRTTESRPWHSFEMSGFRKLDIKDYEGTIVEALYHTIYLLEKPGSTLPLPDDFSIEDPSWILRHSQLSEEDRQALFDLLTPNN